MSKINIELESEINSKPHDEFKVLITLSATHDVNKLKLKDYSILMDNIISARLNSKDIMNLSKNINVLSIELDSEMGVF